MRYLLLFFLFFAACQSENKDIKVLEKYSDKEIQTLNYLENKELLLDENYYSTFNDFYQIKLEKRKFRLLLESLKLVCDNEIYHQSFNPDFKKKLIQFHEDFNERFDKYDWLFYYNYLGNYYYENSEYDKANLYYKKVSYVEPKDEKSLNTIAYSIADHAFCEASAGHYFNALKLNYKSIPLFEKLNDDNGRAAAMMNLGLINLFTRDFKKAKIYLNQAAMLFYKIEDYGNYITCLHNTLILLEESKNPDFFIEIKRVNEAFDKYNLNDLTVKISIKTYYIRYLVQNKKFEEAEALLDKIAIDLESVESEISQIEFLIAKAEFELAKSGEIRNEAELTAMIDKLSLSENYQNQIALYEILIDNEKHKNNWEKALYYTDKMAESKDAFSNIEAQKISQELQESYQKGKMEKSLIEKNYIIDNKNYWIIGLLMVSLTLFTLIAFYILKRKQYDLKRNNLRNQRFTNQLIVKIEEERSRISADLHDSVNHDLLNIKKKLDKTDEAQSEQLADVINNIRNISRNIHPVLFQQIGLAKSVKNLINNVEASHSIPIVSEIDYNDSFDSFEELNIYRIIQECLSNAIKFSDAHAIHIKIEDTIAAFQMTIKDNGRGFDVEKTLASKNIFGLESIYNRAKILNCECKISSSPNGTSIFISKVK